MALRPWCAGTWVHDLNVPTQAGIIETIRTSPKALTVPALASLLDVGRRTIYEHIERGRLKAYRIGTAVRLDPQVTADWLEARWS